METWMVRSLLSLSAFAAVMLILLGLVGGVQEPFAARWRRLRARDARDLDDLFLHQIGPGELWILIAVASALAGLLGYALTDSRLFALLTAAMVPLLRGLLFARLRRRRLERFEEQLPSVLDQLAASARSHLSLPRCIEEVAKRGNPPASQELGLILKDMRMAASTHAAIHAARDRLGSRAFDLVASALTVSLEKGGNLTEVLDRISRSLKELWRLEQKLITASAEGRKAMRMITAMPILLFFMVSASQPDLIDTLVDNPMGWVVLVLAAVLYGIGLVWVRRILAVNI